MANLPATNVETTEMELARKKAELESTILDINNPNMRKAAEDNAEGLVSGGLQPRDEYVRRLVGSDRKLFASITQQKQEVSSAPVVLTEPSLQLPKQNIATSMFSFWKKAEKPKTPAPEDTKIAEHRQTPKKP